MKDFTYGQHEIILLRILLERRIEAVVWDINAFYFNIKDGTFKLGCEEEIPEGANDRFDEIVFSRIRKLEKKLSFYNDSRYTYKIIAEDVQITKIEVLQAMIKFPEEIFLSGDRWNNDIGLNYISLGLLIWIGDRVIPAYVIRNWFGFLWQNKQAIFPSDEIDIDQSIRRIVLQ
jgi:hypothetical protein